MTDEDLPRPAEELEELAAYYDTHDTSAQVEESRVEQEQRR